MNQVMIDIWPYLFGSLLAVIGWLFRQLFNLKDQVKTMEGITKEMQTKLDNTIDGIQKTIENIQKRQDSHSKKQDEFLEKMNSMEKEVLKSMGTVRSEIASLSSDLKGFSNLILVSDQGIKIPRQ